MAQTSLKVMQLGKETTWGTSVAATGKVMLLSDSSLTLVQDSEVIESLGDAGPTSIAVQKSVHGEGSMASVASYEDVVWILNGLLGARSTVGTTAPYVWTYAFPTSGTGGTVTPEFFTVEFGGTGALYKMAGALFTSLSLSGDAADTWKMSSKLVGQSISSLSSLATLTDHTVNVIRMADTNLFVDTWGGSMGATTVAATLIGFTLDVDSGRHLKDFAGSIMPGGYGDGKWSGTLKTTLEFNATAKAYFDAVMGPALTQRQVCIKATQGTNGNLKLLELQCPGTLIDNITMFEDRNGNITCSLTWGLTKHSTVGSYLQVLVKNAINTFPT
jgi:hypothetical protein